MSRLQSTLDTIDHVLVECDARHLPPLTSHTAAAVLDLLQSTTRLDLTPEQQALVRRMYPDQTPEPAPTRRWMPRWIRRNRP